MRTRRSSSRMIAWMVSTIVLTTYLALRFILHIAQLHLNRPKTDRRRKPAQFCDPVRDAADLVVLIQRLIGHAAELDRVAELDLGPADSQQLAAQRAALDGRQRRIGGGARRRSAA